MAAGSGARAEQPARNDTNAVAVQQILTKLRANPELANNRIEVQVDKGVATLKGKVPNQAHKARAERLARAMIAIRGRGPARRAFSPTGTRRRSGRTSAASRASASPDR